MHFGTLKISVFIEIGLVFRLKSAIFSTWRTLMGYTNFPGVGVPGEDTIESKYPSLLFPYSADTRLSFCLMACLPVLDFV